MTIVDEESGVSIDTVTVGTVISKKHEDIRKQGKAYCPHELLGVSVSVSGGVGVDNEDDEISTQTKILRKLIDWSPPYCAKLLTEKWIENATRGANTAVTAITNEAGTTAQAQAQSQAQGGIEIQK